MVIGPNAAPSMAEQLAHFHQQNGAGSSDMLPDMLQMETIHIDFSLFKQDVQNLCETTGATEEQISTIEDTLHPLSDTLCAATDEMTALKAKLDDLEDCSRQNNLCFVGFHKCSEGSHPERFLHLWLHKVFGG